MYHKIMAINFYFIEENDTFRWLAIFPSLLVDQESLMTSLPFR